MKYRNALLGMMTALSIVGTVSAEARNQFGFGNGGRGHGGGGNSEACEQALRNVESAQYAADQAYQRIYDAASFCGTSFACLLPYQEAYNAEVRRVEAAQRNADRVCR